MSQSPYDEQQDPNAQNPYGQDPSQQPYSAPQYGGAAAGPAPDNYLVWAILTTVLCCLPFGIVSIVNSTKVNTLWAQGDVAGAQAASEAAKKWAKIAAIVGVIAGVLYAIFYFVVFAAAMQGQ